jgi:hypothetical protein
MPGEFSGAYRRHLWQSAGMCSVDDPRTQAPPPLPATDAHGHPPAPPAQPWGFWATVGLSLCIGGAWTFTQVIALLLVFAGWVVVGGQPLDVFNSTDELEQNGLVVSVATIASAPVGVGFSLLFASLRRGLTARDYVGLKWVERRALLLWVCLLAGLMAISDGVTTWLEMPVPEFMVEAYQTAGFLPLLWVALVVAAPLGEEFIFRGFLFRGLQASRIGVPGAVLISSLAWTVIHLQYDLYALTWIFLTGLLFGAARARTGSLWLCVVLHALMNAVATAQMALYLQGGEERGAARFVLRQETGQRGHDRQEPGWRR